MNVKVVAFIAFKSAFDYIDWTALWRMLEADNVTKKIITLLKSITARPALCAYEMVISRTQNQDWGQAR